MLPREKIDSCKKLRFCPIAQNFLLVGPYTSSVQFFGVTIAFTYSTYRLEAVASLKFLAIENMPRITVQFHILRQLGHAWRAALVAILPDNFHPSSYLYSNFIILHRVSKMSHLWLNITLTHSPARVVRWLDHLGAMCSRA